MLASIATNSLDTFKNRVLQRITFERYMMTEMVTSNYLRLHMHERSSALYNKT